MMSAYEHGNATDAAAAGVTKLSMTGATHTVPPTMAPACISLRREIRVLLSPSSMMDSSGIATSLSLVVAAEEANDSSSAGYLTTSGRAYDACTKMTTS